MKILVVDDEPEVVESVRLGFTLHWREVEVLGAERRRAALDLVEQETRTSYCSTSACPDMDGYQVLREIRAFSDVPVMMLTARDDAMDKVKGLELGRRRLRDQAVQPPGAAGTGQGGAAAARHARARRAARRRSGRATSRSTSRRRRRGCAASAWT